MSQEFLIQNIWLIALMVGSGLMLVYPVLFGGLARYLTIAEAMLLINHKKAVLIDLRDAASVEQVGSLGGSTRIAYSELESQLPNMPKLKGKPLVFICQTGHQSISATKIAKKLGFNEVYVLKGGLKSWLESGMPIHKSSGSGTHQEAVNKQPEPKLSNSIKPRKRA